MRQEEVDAKEETVYESVFIHLNNRPCKCLLFLLSKLFALLRMIPFVLLAASSQIASQLTQVYSHTNVYLNTI